MKLGVTANWVWFGPPIARLAAHVESLGFESMWMGEHIIVPVDVADRSRYGVLLPENYKHMPDPFVSLAAAATATTTLRFGLDVCLVPQRDPIVLAKTVATLDHVSGGRLMFGYGSGWIEEEAPIMGYPFNKRLGKTLDHMRALKTLWTEERAAYDGPYVSFPPVYSYPKPLQTPHVPILVGSGNEKTDNTKILKRVAETADGWIPSFLSPTQMTEQLGVLRGFCAEAGRDFESLDISLIVPAYTLGVGEVPAWADYGDDSWETRDAREELARYAEAGVTRIVVGLPDMEDESAFATIEAAARGLGL